ncbi:Uncharacterized protein TCM_024624 [Theobroma cacao]|uniref:DUF1985 domain-containing protein n=1 Tax=Theobroma cacao TaxID=3641 RepID=A0A061EVX9_THECC|nr:Uncharacterized protein TCM_024624 [Theobroma cacao]
MALILIANNILLGQDYRRRVMPWLLSLVENIDAWNVFPWGHYVWKLTLDYLLKGNKPNNRYLDVISTIRSVNLRQYGQMPRDRPQPNDDGAHQRVDRARTVQRSERADDYGAQQRLGKVERER